MLSPAQTTSADSRAARRAGEPRSATKSEMVTAVPPCDASPVRGLVSSESGSMSWEWRCVRWAPLTTPSCRPLPPLASGFLEGVAAVGQAVGGDLPEEDATEPPLHRPLGLEADRLGVVVADHHRTVGGDQPRVLRLVVPAAGPALLVSQLVEVAIIPLREAGLGGAL